MTEHEWLGLNASECRRLAELVGAHHAEPTTVVASVAASVIAEPGDSTLGDCIAERGVVAVLQALVEAADAKAFATQLSLPLDAPLASGWSRWTPRLSQRTTVAAIEHAAAVGATVMLPSDSCWPEGLFHLGPHMPHLLYARGSSERNWRRALAIVGARAATGYGEHVAAELAGELAGGGALIVSGAAYGIDGVAHRAALAEHQPTAAFLAGGIDRLYPSGHSELLRRIGELGVVLSETPCGTVPSKFRFLQRNRLIAASSHATVVIEAGRRSGSLNTAGHAATLGRPLGAVPGPITSPASAGCHHLIREYGAQCVTTADDILELAWGVQQREFPMPSTPAPELVRVLDALTTHPQSVQEVAALSGLAVADAHAWLAEAHINGWAETQAGLWLSPRVS